MISNKKNLLINAGLFQILWFAAVIGSANNLVWPCLIMLIILFYWQLQTSRRAATDVSLIVIATLIGLIIETLWIWMGILEYTDERPINFVAPLWILVMWAGFALTINHSMAWMKAHPLLPSLLGLISAPLAYFGGMRLGAVIYNQDVLVVSAHIGLAWAIALPILVWCSRARKPSLNNKEA